MKRIFSIIMISLLYSVACIAQETQGYALAKKGASIQYSYMYGKKLMGYIVSAVQDNKTENGENVITTLWKMLNKKEKPSKTASLMGLKEGLLSSLKMHNGAYKMTYDLAMSLGGENRHGYILDMPATLKVGDVIEGNTIKFENKAMGMTFKNELTYNNFKVVEEVDLTTPAGTFHCLKVTGNIKGTYQKMDIDDNQVWYIARGMGIVRQEINYMGNKRPIILEAYKVNGL